VYGATAAEGHRRPTHRDSSHHFWSRFPVGQRGKTIHPHSPQRNPSVYSLFNTHTANAPKHQPTAAQHHRRDQRVGSARTAAGERRAAQALSTLLPPRTLLHQDSPPPAHTRTKADSHRGRTSKQTPHTSTPTTITDPYLTDHRHIANHGVITLNLRGIGAKHATARRERVYEQIGIMAKKYPKHILFFQETRLDGMNHRALQPIIGQDWLIIYSHYTSTSAGVLTCVPPSLVAAYHIQQLTTPSVLQGHAVAAQLEPRDPLCPTTPSLLLLNIYLSTGEDVNALQTAQLEALAQLGGSPLAPAAYTYAAGDFNFTESPTDTASGVPSVRSAAHTRAWHAFLARHRLREHYQQVHTFYRITRDLTKSTSTRIDRIYTSHDDVDLAVVTAVVAVTNVTTSILDHLRRVRQADNAPIESSQPTNAKLDTDHLPVCLTFTTQSSAAS
jgi:hypothetical protein